MRLEFDQIRLDFDAGWTAMLWDDHTDYRTGLGKLEGSKAVDVVAYSHAHVVLLEGKDLRHKASDWDRLVVGRALATQVAQKVRDTLAALVALRRTTRQPWSAPCDRITAGKPVSVVVWLERPDTYYTDARYRHQLGVFTRHLKGQLAWLPNIIVHVSGSKHSGVPGITGV